MVPPYPFPPGGGLPLFGGRFFRDVLVANTILKNAPLTRGAPRRGER